MFSQQLSVFLPESNKLVLHLIRRDGVVTTAPADPGVLPAVHRWLADGLPTPSTDPRFLELLATDLRNLFHMRAVLH